MGSTYIVSSLGTLWRLLFGILPCLSLPPPLRLIDAGTLQDRQARFLNLSYAPQRFSVATAVFSGTGVGEPWRTRVVWISTSRLKQRHAPRNQRHRTCMRDRRVPCSKTSKDYLSGGKIPVVKSRLFVSLASPVGLSARAPLMQEQLGRVDAEVPGLAKIELSLVKSEWFIGGFSYSRVCKEEADFCSCASGTPIPAPVFPTFEIALSGGNFGLFV